MAVPGKHAGGFQGRRAGSEMLACLRYKAALVWQAWSTCRPETVTTMRCILNLCVFCCRLL